MTLLNLLAWTLAGCTPARRHPKPPLNRPPTLLQVVVLVAAVRSWPELGSHNQGVLVAWLVATIIMPTWRRLQPESFRHARYRPLLERICRTYAAGAPTATSVHLLTMRSKAARVLKLQNAVLFISGVVLHPDGLWGGLHVRRSPAQLGGGGELLRGGRHAAQGDAGRSAAAATMLPAPDPHPLPLPAGAVVQPLALVAAAARARQPVAGQAPPVQEDQEAAGRQGGGQGVSCRASAVPPRRSSRPASQIIQYSSPKQSC